MNKKIDFFFIVKQVWALPSRARAQTWLIVYSLLEFLDDPVHVVCTVAGIAQGHIYRSKQ